MTILFLLLTSLSWAAEMKPAREKIPPLLASTFPREATDECMMLVRLDEDGCNAQTYEVCTDGVTQWETGYKEKTSEKCLILARSKEKEKPMDPELWKKPAKAK